MNILILNWRDPKNPLAGGAEKMLLEHALFWRKKGANITWVSSCFKASRKQESISNIKIERFGSHYSTHLIFLAYAVLGKYKEFDIIIDCFHFIPFFSPLIFNRKKIISVIHEVAGKVWFDNLIFLVAMLGYLIEPFFFYLYKNISFITVSNSTKSELIKFGIKPKKIYVIHNGINLPKKLPTNKKTSYPSLLFLNRIAKDKGIYDTFISFRLVLKSYPETLFVIAGREENKYMMENVMKELKFTKNVEYKGFVSEKEKWKLLKQSWMLIHPSKKEGWGMTVLEANTVGTPVIGYNIEGLKDSIKNNETGLVVDSNPNSLSTGIKKLISNKKEFNKLSKNAEKWAKLFSWEKSTKESWKLIEKTYKNIHQII